jgi:hypothetical protein
MNFMRIIDRSLFRKTTLTLSIILVTFCFAQKSSEAPTVVFITGGDEYQSRERMMPFAEKLEKQYGFKVIYIKDEAPGADTDPDHDPKPTVLPNADKIKEADLLVVYMRFRNWEANSLKLFMDHFEQGKPAVAIRTTTHAFWKDRTFSPKYFGGHYKTHYTSRIVAQVNPEHENHPMVRGVQKKWGQGEGPYVSIPLSEGATPLVFSYGHDRERDTSPGIGNDSYDSPNYPVAWAFNDKGARRAMITLGSYRVGDLEASFFKNLFYNSVFWALGYDVPEKGVLSAGKAFKIQKETKAYSHAAKAVPPAPRFDSGDEWISLFSGDDLSQWRHYDVTIAPNLLFLDHRAASEGPVDYTMSPARWKIIDGTAIAGPGYGDIITKQYFTNYRLRFDFYIPVYQEWVSGEWRGNSGVYLNGSWEVSILDSYGKEATDRSNGAIYRFKAPDLEASRPAGQWQTMEIEFLDGVISVSLNGKLIHNQVKLEKPTFMGFPSSKQWPDASHPAEQETVSQGPIRLQAENSEVRFANIALQRIYRMDSDDEDENDE